MSLLNIKRSFSNGEIDKYEYASKMQDYFLTFKDVEDLLNESIVERVIIEKQDMILEINNKVRLYFQPNERHGITIALLSAGDIEQFERAHMYSLLNDGDIIFDIGANIGWYSLNYAKSYPNSVIYSFEPVDRNFQTLSKNIKLNGFQNIHAHSTGFWHTEATLPFYVYPQNTGASSAADLLETDGMQLINCKVNTLDSFVSQSSITKLDFIKCDVEGSELFVFQGGKNSIERFQPIIFSEMLRKWSKKFNYHPNDIIKFMNDLGYYSFEILGENIYSIDTVTEETISTNYIFLHQDKHSEKIDQIKKNLKYRKQDNT